MMNILGNILGIIVALSIIFGVLCMVTGDETKGNTIIMNSITSTILYTIILCVFSLDGSKMGIFHSAIPMISGLNKYGDVISYLKENPSDFALGFVQLVTLVLVITYLPIMSSPKSLNFQAFSLNIYLITRAKSVEQSLYQVLNS